LRPNIELLTFNRWGAGLRLYAGIGFELSVAKTFCEF
jgi:hypothetical protein